jgi:VWFA-related protein
MRRDFPILLPATLLLASLPAGAARPQAEAPPVFSSSISLVLLPVFVVDKDGRATRGLSVEDFEIYEDGKRVPAASFRYVDTTAPEDQESLRQATAARRRFMLLFDKSFTDPSGLNRARRAAAEFVRRRLAPSDLAAVATFDTNQGLRLVANFTEDRALLAHAVDTLGVPQLARISDPLGLAADFASTDIAGLRGSGGQETPQALLDSVLGVLAKRAQAAEDQHYRDKIQILIAGFDELARGLRLVEGRKQVLYFSAGFDSRLLVGEEGQDQKNASEAVAQGRLWEVDGMTRFGDTRLRDLLGEMTGRLARSDTVLHAIDVTGLSADPTRLDQPGSRSDPGRANPGRQALNLISSETGGRFFTNANDLRPVLDEMLEMTSRYYVLGFQPASAKGPGEYHKVKVKVRRTKTKVSHRPGYYERIPVANQTVLQRRFEAAQLVMSDLGPNDIKFSSLCLPFPGPGERQALGLVVQVPRDSVPWAEGKPALLEFYGYAVAEDGTVHDHVAKQVRLDSSKLNNGISFHGVLHVPAGRYTLRFMVREIETGTTGVQLLDVTVPPYNPRAGFLLPPVVVDDVARWLTLGVGSGAGDQPTFPFKVEGEAFLPRASFEVQSGRPERLVLYAYEPERPGDPAADLQISSSLTDRAGKLVGPGFLKIDAMHRAESGLRTYVLGYTPGALAAGDYTLRIGVGESGALLESYALIRVRPGS